MIDLWERKALYGAPDDLIHDPYVFKCKPMAIRTWFYHYFFSDPALSSSVHGEHGLMEHILSFEAVDVAGRNDARWSSAVCLAPAGFISIFCADLMTTAVSVSVLIFNISASVLANNPRFYSKVRAVTFLPRLFLFLFVWIRMLREGVEALQMVGFVGMMFFQLIDFYLGDLQAINVVKWHCHYEVLRSIPETRIFMCRRKGAAFLKTNTPEREVSELVTGTVAFPGLVVIAEIRGLICELVPMDRTDWVLCWERIIDTSVPFKFLGLDVFNNSKKSLYDMWLKADRSGEFLARLAPKITDKKNPEQQGNAPELLS